MIGPVSRTNFISLARTNVIEATFIRRHLKPGWSNVRRTLCTTNWNLLDSNLGREVLHFRIAYGTQPYSLVQKNLIVVWDILWQDYRQFDGDSGYVFQTWPVATLQQRDKWWDYFYQNVFTMTSEQKAQFMND